MKIENYETWKSDVSADTLTFPYNPNRFEDTLQKKLQTKNIAYAFSYFGATSPLKNSRVIVINGHFSGASKNSDFQSLVKHVNDNNVKKLYFDNSKFMIVFPQNIKRTHQGGRTNFIGYNAGFISPFGILFGDTQKSGGSSDSDVNDGNTLTPIERVSGSVTSGEVVSVVDSYGNGFEFTASTSGTLNVRLLNFRNVGSDVYFTEYYFAEVDGVEQNLRVKNNDKSMFMVLNSGDSLSGFSDTNIAATFYFRDGYSAD